MNRSNERRVRIVWPEARFVPESTLATWFLDAIENNEIERGDRQPESDSLEFIAMELHYAGIITLHKYWKQEL